MSMEYKEVKELVDDSLKPLLKEIGDIKDTVEPIPRLVERLTTYKDIENTVTCHDFILRGTQDKPGIVNDIKVLKNQGKKMFNWIVKIAAFAGSLLGALAVLKSFGIF